MCGRIVYFVVVPHLKALISGCLKVHPQGCGSTFTRCHALNSMCHTFPILPRFQPVELVKPLFIIFVAKIIILNENTNVYKRYLYSFLILLLIVIFLINQPDVGQTLLLASTWITMIFVSGFNMFVLSILSLIFLCTIALLVFFFPGKFGYIFLRIKTFVDPQAGDNFQSQKALDAIKEGGLTGQGMGEGILAGVNSFLDGLNYMVKSVFEFFQTFVDGIGNVIQKVAKVISKTFINLMQGLGKGIEVLFRALGSINPFTLTMGAAALGAITLSLMGMGLALKLAAPFINSVFGGIAKIFTSLGKVAKLVSEAIVGLMDGITSNLTELTKIPFMNFIKLGLGFAALGAGLFVFGTMSQIAIPALFAIGAASMGLSQLFNAVPADQLSLMATGFRQLAGAVRDFGINSLFLGPAVGLLTALSAIPFANKIIDLALSKSDMKSQGAESFQTDNLIVGSIRSNASQALMSGQEQAMNSRIENQFGQQKSGGDNTITTTAINNNEQHFHNTKSARNENLEYSQKVISIAGI